MPLTISAQYGLIAQTDFFSKSVASRDVSDYYLIKNGDFAYNKSYSNGYPLGAIKRLDNYEMGVLSTLYIIFKPTNVDSNFLTKYYDSTYWHREVSKHAAEGARNHGLLNIAASDFFKTDLYIPSDRNEQVKIGHFLTVLENAITLHQRKLDQLKDLKQAYLQQLFPSDGEYTPKVRFANFNQDWEQRKLGESVDFINGRAYKQKELLSEGKYRVLRVGNFNTNDSWYFSDLELDADKYANKGDLLYLWATNFGPVIWNEESVIYHYHIWKLQITDKYLDKEYLYTWLTTDKERIKQTTNGTTMVHVTKGGMEERKFQSPKKIEEQINIGIFFKQLDETISLHQQKLSKLERLKSAYLQKMFI